MPLKEVSFEYEIDKLLFVFLLTISIYCILIMQSMQPAREGSCRQSMMGWPPTAYPHSSATQTTEDQEYVQLQTEVQVLVTQ